MDRHTTDTLLMIRPKHFGYNPETAENNAFQSDAGNESDRQIEVNAIQEFDQFVEVLKNEGVRVVVMEDTDQPQKPDAVFPNNWISFHENGAIITYPMFSEIRRKERREDIVTRMEEEFGFDRRYSFEHYEEEEMFLEGTGSMILDRANKIVYACHSERTDARVLDKWAVLCEYERMLFHAVDRNGAPIYHTNVMMAMGDHFVVICLAAIENPDERKEVLNRFLSTGKEVVEISYDQMESFAGNMLQVEGNKGALIIMSSQAYESLGENQVDTLSKYGKLIYADISTIEKYGGGSVRCMMAEVFYPV